MTSLKEAAAQPPAAVASTTRYHWVVTLQYVTQSGAVAASTIDGVASLPAGYSREQAFGQCNDAAFAKIAEREAVQDRPRVVLFFALEPDELLPPTLAADGPAASVIRD